MNKGLIKCKNETNFTNIVESLKAEGYKLTLSVIYVNYPIDDTIDHYEIEYEENNMDD